MHTYDRLCCDMGLAVCMQSMTTVGGRGGILEKWCIKFLIEDQCARACHKGTDALRAVRALFHGCAMEMSVSLPTTCSLPVV